MKKLGSFIAMVCVLNLLMIGGLVGYLFGTGRLDKEKATTIVDMVKHQGTPEKFREQVYDILEPATSSAPASQQGAVAGSQPAEAGPVALSAEDRLDATRQAIDQERIRLTNEAQELRHRQELLAQTQHNVEAKLQQVEDAQKKFDASQAKVDTTSKDEAFQKSLSLYNELKTKQVKEIFIGMTPELVAKFLQSMETDRAGKIIAEFKTPDESKFIAIVLEHIRTNGTSAASGPRTSGNTAAVAPGT